MTALLLALRTFGGFLFRNWAVVLALVAGFMFARWLSASEINRLEQDVDTATLDARTAWATVKTHSDATLAFKAQTDAQNARTAAALAAAQTKAKAAERRARDLINQPRPPGLTPCENACRILEEYQP